MVLGVGCWGYFLFGFLEYDHGFAPGSAAKANLLTGWVLQILLHSSSSGSALRFHSGTADPPKVHLWKNVFGTSTEQLRFRTQTVCNLNLSLSVSLISISLRSLQSQSQSLSGAVIRKKLLGDLDDQLQNLGD
jgi:hypothetical protein